jgi:hypothetical protein
MGGSREAAAQDLSWSSAVEAAGDEVYVVFTQPTLRFGPQEGLRPSLSLGAYHVWTPGEDTWGLTPAAGLGYHTGGGMIAGTVGWAIRDADDAGESDFFGGSDNGLHTGVHTEFWGDGSWALQGIASYNWGSDFLWSRARVLKGLSGGSTSLGAELVWQAKTDDGDLIDDNEFQATYIGPVVQFSRPNGSVFAVSGGLKMTEPDSPTTENDTWYAKVEFNLP